MNSFWALTGKRRENLVKACLNALTADLTGLVVPFFLQPRGVPSNILLAGIFMSLVLLIAIYVIEK